jgi:hypothetical protein
MNPKIVKLLHEGFSMDTLERLNSKQLSALYERVSKKETKEATTKTITSTTYSPDEAKGKSFQGTTTVKPDGSVEVTKEGEMTEDEEDSMNFEKGMRTQLPKQVGPSTNDGSNNYGDGLPAESNLQEKAVSKQQQKIMGLALSVKKGDTPKSKVSKSVEKMSKEMSKKDLEDFASTKHKGLPKKIEATESIKKGVKRNDQKDMIDGVIEILKKVKDINNRKSIAKDMVNKFKREGIQTDFNKFMEDCGVDDTKKPVKNIGINKSDEQKKSKKIEESILSIIQNHLPPHTTKGEVMRSLNKRK